jgi:riboflavin synthase
MNRDQDGESIRMDFKILGRASEMGHKPTLLQYIVTKGYVALDGASLTVTHVDDKQHTFGVMLIRHTQERITLGFKEVGDKVNVEADSIGKYVEKSVAAALEGGGGSALKSLVEKVVEEALAKKGIQ